MAMLMRCSLKIWNPRITGKGAISNRKIEARDDLGKTLKTRSVAEAFYQGSWPGQWQKQI